MIGWYVHGHGSGHVQRVQCIASHLRTPITVLSSQSRPCGFEGPWIQLDNDAALGAEVDVTAGGTLHWAPQHHAGLRKRMGAVAAWITERRPHLMVVDVSVEVAVLARTMGVPVVVVAMRGERTDRPHQTAYDLASALLAPWPEDLAESWPERWLAKTWHVGALSRYDGRWSPSWNGGRHVTVLWGSGGSDVCVADFEAARRATPEWRWTLVGVPGSPWIEDVWSTLVDAAVVVTHGGQNALAEVAASRRPAVVIPQARPHGEQRANAAALARGGLAVVRNSWPHPDEWAATLNQAARSDPAGWERWSDGRGAQRAAGLLDEAAACALR